MTSLGQQPNAVAWRHKPSTYVVSNQDMAVHPGLQRILAPRCATSTEWETGHSPFASQPHLVASLITELASDQPGAAG